LLAIFALALLALQFAALFGLFRAAPALATFDPKLNCVLILLSWAGVLGIQAGRAIQLQAAQIAELQGRLDAREP